MPNTAEFTGPYRPTPAFAVNGEGFDAAVSRFLLSDLRLPEPLPVRTIPTQGQAPNVGMCLKRPWEYEVTAVIPCLNSAERLPYILDILRLQTIKPFILLIDTGSTPEQYARIEKFRAQDLEVHSIRLNGVENSSEPVSMAMDVAAAVCRTRFMFCTHDDCFLRSRIALQYFRDLASTHRVAGHVLTPRPHDDWPGMFGHTALMLDMDFFLDHGLSWNMRRCVRQFGSRTTAPRGGNWPDTEIGLNYLFRQLKVKPFLTGMEANFKRNKDALIDHCRSAGSSAVYDKKHAHKAQAWLERAIEEARKRIADWLQDELPEAAPLPPELVKAKRKLPKFTPGTC